MKQKAEDQNRGASRMNINASDPTSLVVVSLSPLSLSLSVSLVSLVSLSLASFHSGKGSGALICRFSLAR